MALVICIANLADLCENFKQLILKFNLAVIYFIIAQKGTVVIAQLRR